MTTALFYGTARVCDLAGVTYRQLNYWTTDLGIIRTRHIEGVPSRGSGNWRVYDHTEAAIAEAVGVMKDVRRSSSLLRQVAENGSADLGTLGEFRIVRVGAAS